MPDTSGPGVAERIDAHLHLWELGEGRYSWLGPQHGGLYRSHTATEAGEVLASAGIGRAVLVQAEDTAADTEFMLAQADANPWIAGVVGWIPLEEPAAAERQLDTWLENDKFRGVRTLIHDDPRTDLLEYPQVRRTLSMVADRGLPFDVPDAFPRHLGQVAALAADLPELTLVVDHLGKPPFAGGTENFDLWAEQLRAVAALPITVAKVSGLFTAGAPYTARALAPAWELALDCFGPERLMFGGDWPVSNLGAPYSETVGVLAGLIDSLSPTEAAAVWAGTARRVYRL